MSTYEFIYPMDRGWRFVLASSHEHFEHGWRGCARFVTPSGIPVWVICPCSPKDGRIAKDDIEHAYFTALKAFTERELKTMHGYAGGWG